MESGTAQAVRLGSETTLGLIFFIRKKRKERKRKGREEKRKKKGRKGVREDGRKAEWKERRKESN